MNFFEQIAEAVELAVVRDSVTAYVKSKNEALKDMFEELGVQVDIKVEVNVEGVDLKTFRSGFKTFLSGGVPK